MLCNIDESEFGIVLCNISKSGFASCGWCNIDIIICKQLHSYCAISIRKSIKNKIRMESENDMLQNNEQPPICEVNIFFY